jgi:hypothetical protein
MNKDLSAFIAHARKKGMDHATIRMLLLSAGWREKDIAEAMTEESLEMPVPMPPDTGGARDAFFHLLTFVALYTSVISLIILFFDYIGILFPDAALQTYPGMDDGTLSSIRWAIAAIIVSFPLFFWLSRILLKEMQMHVEKAASGVRRWLTYLTLFVTAAALMGDVITLVFYFLDGELSTRFVLKVLVILLLAGCSFTYYFLALRTPPMQAKQTGLNRKFAWLALFIVAVAVVWGIVLAGSPASQRAKQFDDRRVEDLRGISSEIGNIVFNGKMGAPNATMVNPIPKTLDEVAAKAMYQKPAIADPETSQPYEFTVQSAKQYQLCATFNAARDLTYDVFWNHPVGHYCYTFDLSVNRTY